MTENGKLISRLWLIRVAVWAQAMGYIWQASAMAIEDAPEVFERAGIGSFLWPLGIVLAMHLFKLDKRIAERSDTNAVVVFAMLASVTTLIISILGVKWAYDLPPELVTADWAYTQGASIITLILYATGFGLTVTFSYRALRRA